MDCNICNSNKGKILFCVKDYRYNQKKGEKFILVKCNKCELAYLDPLPKEDIVTNSYNYNYFKLNNNKSNRPKGKLIYFLRYVKNKLIPKNNRPKYKIYRHRKSIFVERDGKFLDIGCATGVLEKFLIEEFSEWKFFGIEPNKEAFDEAVKIKDFEVVNGVLEKNKYQDSYFDVILLNHVLEHVIDPNAIIKECGKILKNRGRLVIAVPDFDSLSSKIFRNYWYHLDAPRHLYQFNVKSLEYLLDKNGFKILEVKKEFLDGSVLKSLAIFFGIKPDELDASYLYLTIKILLGPLIDVFNKMFESIGISSGIFIVAIKK